VRAVTVGITAMAAVAGTVYAIHASEPRRSTAVAPVAVVAPTAPATAEAVEAPVAPIVAPVVAESAPSVAPQPPASAGPTRLRAAAPADEIAGQIALIDAARSALSTGAPDRALDVLGQYQARYPAGSFRPEAVALRIQALAKLGRMAEARALAERFVAEHRGSPLASRVAREVGLSAP
jgi:hypothetical protein